MLRLRQALMLIEARIGAALAALADLAEAHAETPQAARTYGQVATPSSFGALVASWGSPLLRLHDRLEALRPRVLCVSLSGAAGTASMLGADPDALRAALAEALGLSDPGDSWHASRDRIGEIAGWLADLTTACGKIGADLTLLTRSEIGEIGLPGAGGVLHHAAETEPGCAVAAGGAGPLRAGAGGGAAGRGGPCRGAGRRGVVRRMADLPPLTAAPRAPSRSLGELAAGLEVRDGRHGPPSRRPAGPDPCRGALLRAGPALGRAEAQAQVKTLAAEARGTGIPLPELVPARIPGRPARPLRPRNAGHCTAAGARAFAGAARARVAKIAERRAEKN
jgi:3-carboxy-cis,cis-muconate cycloisomerase